MGAIFSRYQKSGISIPSSSGMTFGPMWAIGGITNSKRNDPRLTPFLGRDDVRPRSVLREASLSRNNIVSLPSSSGMTFGPKPTNNPCAAGYRVVACLTPFSSGITFGLYSSRMDVFKGESLQCLNPFFVRDDALTRLLPPSMRRVRQRSVVSPFLLRERRRSGLDYMKLGGLHCLLHSLNPFFVRG